MARLDSSTPRRFTVEAGELSRHTANRPSLFADPVAWLVAEAVEAVIAGSDSEHTGLIVCSEVATSLTMAALAATARTGQVSPMRFAGANPGVVAGLACIRLGLRGPALLLTMAPAAGRPAALMMAAGWLRDGAASTVVTVEHECAGRQHRLTAVRHRRPA